MGYLRLPLLLAVLAATLGACGTVAVAPPAEDGPLFQRIDARVGTSYASAARLASVTNPLMRIDVGQSSVAHFEKAFGAMFRETVALPDWPPWRHETPPVDGVIELERGDAELVLGDDLKRPDVARVTYRVCLYATAGTEIRCWTASGRSSHQRRIGECLDLRACFVPQMEMAMREAIALFLVEADKDAAVRRWAAGLSGERRP